MMYLEELFPDTWCKLHHYAEMDLWELAAGKTVVDAGCGTGFYAMRLAQHAANVMAVDLSEANIAWCRDNIEGVDFRTGEIERLPLPDSSVDLVFCAEVLEHVKDSRAVLVEMARILRPGAALLLAFPIRPALPTTRFLEWCSDALTNWYYGKTHPMAHQRVLHHTSVAAEIQGLGFSVTEIRRIQCTGVSLLEQSMAIAGKLLTGLSRRSRLYRTAQAEQTHWVKTRAARAWSRCMTPLMRWLARKDSAFRGFDSTCAVILARKK